MQRFSRHTINCITCGETTSRGRDPVTNKFTDELGRNWHGYSCPDCGESKKSAVKRRHVSVVKRNCRSCSMELPATRYFHCQACAPKHVEEPVYYWGYGLVESQSLSGVKV